MREREWLKIKEILWDALEQPPAERRRFLREKCGADASLLEELELLLEASEDADPLLEKHGFDLNDVFAAQAPNYAGRRFGHFRIIREIGSGGMGAVFLAERADGEFNQQVALKIVRQTIIDQEIERRFKRERQILASLHHPHIAALLDGGVSANGETFLAMEYIDGEPLLDFARRRNLSVEARLDLFLKVCSAVEYAHRNGVIHRDIKPANILVTKDGEPKLLDFGLAKFLESERYGLDTSQTETRFRAFTLGYASPEQIRGEPLTTASDVYSLSVVLYELLTGGRPFHFENKSLDEILKTLGDTEPPAPSRVTGGYRKWGERTTDGNKNPGEKETLGDSESQILPQTLPFHPSRLKGDLDNICLMGLRKEPARRYESVARLAEDVKAHLRGLPVSARPNTYAYRAMKLFKRNKTAAVASLCVVAALAVSLASWRTALVPNQFQPAEERRSMLAPEAVKVIAVMPLKSLNSPPTDGELRVGLADSIVTKLGSVRQIAVRPTSATIRYLDHNYDLRMAGEESKADSILEGSLQKIGGRLLVNLQMVSVADGRIVWAESFHSDLENLLSGQDSIANRVSRIMALNTDAPLPEISSPNLMAQDAYLKGNYALNTSNRKIENIFLARDFFERAIRLDENFALAHSGLAMMYTLAGSLTLLSPQESYPLAERAARRALEIDPNMAAAYVVLGEVEADYNWNWAAAEANFKRALELAPNLAAAHHGYCEFLARQRRFAEADYHSRMAQQLDPTRINYAAVRALHYLYERRYDDAVAQSRRTIERSKNAYLAYLYLNTAENMRGNYAAAEAAGKKAFEITGGGPADLFVLGNTYALMKDERRTKEILDKLEAMGRRQYSDPIHFVVIHGFRGDMDKAFAYLEKCYREKSYWMTALNANPVFDTLRGDPRFAEYLKKMNLDD